MKYTLKLSVKKTLRLARALGQSEDMLRQIEEGNAHPIMAAYGLWLDDAEGGAMAETITRGRKRLCPRPEVRQ
jgi:hypothetical protein